MNRKSITFLLICVLAWISALAASQTLSQAESASQRGDARGIQEAITHYYQALCAGQPAEAIACWSSQSPGYTQRKQSLEYFVKATQLSVQRLRYTDLKLADNTASVRLVIDHAYTFVFPVRRRVASHDVRIITLVRTPEGWRLTGLASPVTDLAARLAGSAPTAWSTMLAEADQDLITASLTGALRTVVLSCIAHGDTSQGKNAVAAALFVARKLRNRNEEWETIRQYVIACHDAMQVQAAKELLNSIKQSAIQQKKPLYLADAILLECEYCCDGDGAHARALAQEAERLFVAEHMPEGISRARTSLGIAFLRDQDYKNGSKWLRLSLHGASALLAPVIWMNIGRAEMDQHHASQALAAYTTCLTLLEKTTDASTEAEVRNKQGIAFLEQGDLIHALQNLQKSLALYMRLASASEQGQVHLNIGLVYYSQGQYKNAEAEYVQARALLKGPADKTALATAWLHSGHIAAALQHYPEALHAAQSCLETGSPDVRGEALTLQGMVLRSQGDYPGAQHAFEQYLKLAQDSHDDLSIGTALNNLGSLAMAQKDYVTARTRLENSRKIFEKLHVPYYLSHTLRNLGITYHALHDPQALPCYKEALRIAERINDSPARAQVEFSMGNLRFEAKDFQGAEDHYKTALSLAEAMGDPMMSLYATWHLGKVKWMRDQFPDAISIYEKAIKYLEDIRQQVEGGEEAKLCFVQEGDKSLIYSELAQMLIANNQPGKAFEVVQRAQSKGVIDALRARTAIEENADLRKLLNTLASLESALAVQEKRRMLEAAKKKSEQNPVLLANASIQIAATWKELRNLQDKFNRVNADYQKQISVEIPLLKSLKIALHKDEVAVEYVPMADTLLAFVVSPNLNRQADGELHPQKKNAHGKINKHTADIGDDGQFHGYVVPVSHKALSDLITRCHDAMQNPFADKDGELRKPEGVWDWRSPEAQPLKQILTSLYSYLINPIRREIDQAHVMRIIPCSDLRNLPFQALAYQKQDGSLRFLAQDTFPIIVPRQQKEFPHDNAVLSPNTPEHLAIFADPGGKRRGTAEEGWAIHRMFEPSSRLYIHDDATLEHLSHLPPDTTCLLLATEAKVETDESRSYIEMANGENLSPTYLSGIQLHVRLTVLSTCVSAYYPSDDRLTDSLSDRFLEAGSKSVIASLWKINDASTREWMVAFFSHIHAGEDIVHAKQAAEVEMLQAPATAHPYFWSAFTLSGEWR